MKCPKCGFTSFDFLENCKKCGQELQGHKTKFGLRSLIFPNLGGPSETAEGTPESSEPQETSGGDGFGFDFMSEEAEQASGQASEPAAAEPAATEAPAAEETEGDFSFDSAEDDGDGFDFAAEEEAADGFDFSEAENENTEDDFDFSEEEVATETGVEPADETDDEFAFTETDEELDGSTAEGDLDFSEEAEESSDFGDWDDSDDATEEDEENLKKQAADAEEPSDPFDLRGSAELERIPGESLPAIDPDDSDQSVNLSTLDEEDELEPISEPETLDQEPTEPFSAAAEEEPQQVLFGFQDEGREAENPLEDSSGFEHGAFFPATDDIEAELEPCPPLFPRLAASLCDLLILAVVFILFLMVGELTLSDPGKDGLLPGVATLLELSGPYFMVFFALCFGYFTLFHFLTGQTPGKMLFGLRVEDLAGEPLNFSQAFLRSVGGLFSLLPAGLGYLVIVFNSSRRGWNDLLAGSQLVLLAEQGEETLVEQEPEL